jgi:hypothetical protein
MVSAAGVTCRYRRRRSESRSETLAKSADVRAGETALKKKFFK